MKRAEAKFRGEPFNRYARPVLHRATQTQERYESLQIAGGARRCLMWRTIYYLKEAKAEV
jgi:hypothetical protein